MLKKTNLISLAIILIICCMTSNAVADDATLNLKQAIDLAVSNNPGIKAVDQDVKAKKMDRNAALASMLPSVTGTYTAAQLDEEYPEAWLPVVSNYGVAPTSPFASQYAYMPSAVGKFNYSIGVEVSQPLFTGGALYNNYQISRNEVQIAHLNRKTAVRDLKLGVIQAYYGVIEARKFYDVAQASLETIKAHMQVAQAFFDEGMIPKNDLLIAQVKHAEAEQQLIMAANAVKLAESAFNLALSRDLAEPVMIENDVRMLQQDKSFETAIQAALQNRPELMSLKIQQDSAKRGVRLADSAFLPTVGASCKWERTGDHSDTDDDHSWTAGIGLEWKLFEGSSHFWNHAKARAVQNQLDYYYQAQQDLILLEVKNAYLNSEEALARTKVAAKAIAQARENLRIEKDRYKLQVATSTDVLDAQTMLTHSEQNYISARVGYAKALAELQSAMGTL